MVLKAWSLHYQYHLEIPRFSWILEPFGGEERNIREVLISRTSFLNSKGVPLGYLNKLSPWFSKSLAVVSQYSISFLLLLGWLWSRSVLLNCNRSLHSPFHSLIPGYIASLMHTEIFCIHFLPIFEPHMCQAPEWPWGAQWYVKPDTVSAICVCECMLSCSVDSTLCDSEL